MSDKKNYLNTVAGYCNFIVVTVLTFGKGNSHLIFFQHKLNIICFYSQLKMLFIYFPIKSEPCMTYNIRNVYSHRTIYV